MPSKKTTNNKFINIIFLLLLIVGVGLIFQAIKASQVSASSGCFPNQFCQGASETTVGLMPVRSLFAVMTAQGVFLLLVVVYSEAEHAQSLFPALLRKFSRFVSSTFAYQILPVQKSALSVKAAAIDYRQQTDAVLEFGVGSNAGAYGALY